MMTAEVAGSSTALPSVAVGPGGGVKVVRRHVAPLSTLRKKKLDPPPNDITDIVLGTRGSIRTARPQEGVPPVVGNDIGCHVAPPLVVRYTPPYCADA